MNEKEGMRKADPYGKAERAIWAIISGELKGKEDETHTVKMEATDFKRGIDFKRVI